jgi:uncharacterized protein YjiS (DUF1127 family)
MNFANRTTGFGGLRPAFATRTVSAPEFATRAPAGRAPVRVGLNRWLSGLRQAFELRRERARTRRALAHLDDRLLRDLGLSRADVGIQLAQPFPGLGEALTRERAGFWHL